MDIQKTIAGVFRKSMKSKLGNAIMDLLSKEGFRPKIDNGYIVFKIEGTTFYFNLDDKDEYFVRLVLPNFYEVTNENKVLALYNMNYLNFNFKLTKFYMNDNLVSVGIDTLLYPENTEKNVFRLLDTVRGSAGDFCKEMDKGFSCN